MKNILLYIVLSLLTVNGYTQTEKNLDFVIIMDNEVVLSSIVRPKIKIQYNNDSIANVGIKYHPGNLSLNTSDYEKVLGNNVAGIYIVFSYQLNGKKQEERNYTIQLQKSWLKSAYNVLRIYNVDFGPYKGVFSPCSKDEKYTFELFSPDNTFTRVRKSR